jgi:type VII secretion protein EccE
MRSPIRVRFTTGHAIWLAALGPLAVMLFMNTRYQWAGPALVGLFVVLTMVTFFGRRITGWVLTISRWFGRRRQPPPPPSEPVVGATVQPGDHVAVRWQGEYLVSIIELVPRPFTPTVIVDGKAHTDDLLDTRLLERLLSVHCPDLEADVVSAGYRVGTTASRDAIRLYRQVIRIDPAPASRRTWIMLRADPVRTRRPALRRDEGVAGLARYLVASTTRIADQLASHGVDAVCCRSFDDFDHATDIGFAREKWSMILGRNTYTVAYTAPAGPDTWWATRADHTITRVRIAVGESPQSTVLLTSLAKPKTPRGFNRLWGGQKAALGGQTLVTNRHFQLPIGSAGLLIGETAQNCPVYMPFDDVDMALSLGDAQAFTQFAIRAAAAGAIVTVGPQFKEFAELIGAQIGPVPKVTWPNATTYLGPHPGVDRVILRHNAITTPRHKQLPIHPISAPEESRYEGALPGRQDDSPR